MTAIDHKTLEVRLAKNLDEVDAAQALRYRVFFDEMGAVPDAVAKEQARDRDAFDPHCDHLLVIDRTRPKGRQVVGTYRIMRRAVALKQRGFYSADEYDVSPLLGFEQGEVMELGRSCVDAAYRSRGTMQLLWRGLADYIDAHHIGLMFGCASMHGTDPNQHAQALSYLHHYHPAPAHLQPRALDHRYVDMNRMARRDINVKAALISLPPLLKGYLRVGAVVGDGAVIDRDFNTTDVCIIVQTSALTEKYHRHYGLTQEQSA